MFSTHHDGEERYEVSVKRIIGSELSSEAANNALPANWRVQQKVAADCSSALWLGEIHHFTPQQRLAIKVLWEAFQSGLPDVHQREILHCAGSKEAKLRKLFEGNKAWGRMIFPSREFGGRVGFYRLDLPPEKRGQVEAIEEDGDFPC
jgi:hypothetical protein